MHLRHWLSMGQRRSGQRCGTRARWHCACGDFGVRLSSRSTYDLGAVILTLYGVQVAVDARCALRAVGLEGDSSVAIVPALNLARCH